MTPDQAAHQIAKLIRAGYLQQAGRSVPGVGDVLLEDEFVVWCPSGPEGRSDVLAALRNEMDW